jgi:hypothetical protein
VDYLSIPLTITRYLTTPSTIYRYATRYRVSEYLIVSRLATAVNVNYYDDSGSLVTSISYPTQIIISVETVFQGVYVSPQPPSAGQPSSTATTPETGQVKPRQFKPRPVIQPTPVALPV